jgi:hypothetical protein
VVENLKAQHGVPAESPREEWAYLEYTVGADLAVTRAKAHHASSPAFAEIIAREMVEGRGHSTPGPGTYRSFELRAPQDRPGFGEPRRVSRALKVLKEPLAEAGVETGQLAVRVELSASGRLVRRQEIFSTHPGLSEHIAAPLDRFLAESGLDQAGRPLVLFLIFHLDQGKVVSASTTNYIAG